MGKSVQAGKYDIHFEDIVEEGFDLIVGADGAWSRVRPFLSNQLPVYSGITCVELWAFDVDPKHKWLAQYVDGGSCFMFDEGRAIMAQVNGNNTIRTLAAVRQPVNWQDECGIDWSSPKEAFQKLVDEYYADCAPELKRVILDSDDEVVLRKMWMLPIGWRWESNPGVTLIGDAAHLMTPFAGV